MSDDVKDEPRLLSSLEAAQRLGLGPNALPMLRCRGEGPAYVKFGQSRSSRVFYRPEDLDAWVAAHLRTTTESED